MQGGIFRRKYRLDRRPGLPIESRASFYSKYFAEFVRKNLAIVQHAILLRKLQWKIERDPNHLRYTDSALSIATSEQTDPLEFYSHREAAADAAATV
jgi:hypothetical protein